MVVKPENSGMTYNIQRFSIHDGPGIRTTVFLKGCPLRCFWCQNPESQRREPELFFLAEKCIGCGRCIPTCPVQAISRAADGSIVTDRDKCTGCGSCTSVCPVDARTQMGKELTVDEVMEVVLKDKNFYVNSGGGVTISGGDSVAQPGFAIAILKACREAGIHTTIETCAFASWEVFEQILEYTDLVYMDIKCIDSDLHQRCTGVPNKVILENAVKTAKLRPMRVRVPVIPKFNDDPAELMKIAEFARNEMGITEIELLKYNKLCESKYLRLDRDFAGEKDLPADAELEQHMTELRTFVGAKQ